MILASLVASSVGAESVPGPDLNMLQLSWKSHVTASKTLCKRKVNVTAAADLTDEDNFKQSER